MDVKFGKVVSLAALLVYANSVHCFKCYRCSSTSSFEDCAQAIRTVNCEELQELSVPGSGTSTSSLQNVTFACTSVSLAGTIGKRYIKTCIPSLPEAQFCELLKNQTQLLTGLVVQECNVCYRELCNGSDQLNHVTKLLVSSVALSAFMLLVKIK
ncbi:uncharacterized protein LOC125952789 [Anopheles darlingi]|uniref:uncharacterized protein LOC125952789 n=1 Tax=Anopheles darlingi TaxID=43151 RepID=UPI002100662E|nr:uncharacterized protein LOC125952789 [Anopheles darlingi]